MSHMKHERHSTSGDVKLLPGERLIKVEEVLSSPPTQPPSGLRELYRLARVSVEGALHEFNPPLASLALESNDKTDSVHKHLYEALFGRDSLRVALDMLPFYPGLTRATLITLAELQGKEYNNRREEEPGRIIHEVRKADDPIAMELSALRGWDWPYYGSVDATPEFIRTVAAYCKQAPEGTEFLLYEYRDKNNESSTMADALSRAVDWILRRLSDNPEGLLEFKTAIPNGIENQVWKDSWDAYFHKDGRIANHEKGIASVEVQRLAYDALLDAAELYEEPVIGQPMYAHELRTTAQRLRNAIFEHFWTPEQGGYFALGTDRNANNSLNQLKIRTSNMGHLLHSRLLDGHSTRLTHMREAIVRQLFSSQMLAPSGIRTLASDEFRFRPGAYHNGSVWLWDTHFIAKGLRRHKYFQLADLLSERLFKVIDTTMKFPEFVRGDTSPTPVLNNKIVDVWDETYQRPNRIEQPPQEVQAWSVAAILALKHYNHSRRDQAKPPITPFEQSVLDKIDHVD